MKRHSAKSILQEVYGDLQHERPIVARCSRCRCEDARIYPEAVAARLFGPDGAHKGCLICPQCSFSEPMAVADLEWLARGAHLVKCEGCREEVGPPPSLLERMGVDR